MMKTKKRSRVSIGKRRINYRVKRLDAVIAALIKERNNIRRMGENKWSNR